MNQKDLVREFEEFYTKFTDKMLELQNDFNNLSDFNKQRVESEIKRLLKFKFPDLLKLLQEK